MLRKHYPVMTPPIAMPSKDAGSSLPSNDQLGSAATPPHSVAGVIEFFRESLGSGFGVQKPKELAFARPSSFFDVCPARVFARRIQKAADQPVSRRKAAGDDGKRRPHAAD
jgi:hypothetical protein